MYMGMYIVTYLSYSVQLSFLLPWLHREVVHGSIELSHHLHTSVWGAY
jgi:hypothetical protein